VLEARNRWLTEAIESKSKATERKNHIEELERKYQSIGSPAPTPMEIDMPTQDFDEPIVVDVPVDDNIEQMEENEEKEVLKDLQYAEETKKKRKADSVDEDSPSAKSEENPPKKYMTIPLKIRH